MIASILFFCINRTRMDGDVFSPGNYHKQGTGHSPPSQLMLYDLLVR